MIDNVSIKQRIEQFDLKHGVEHAVKSLDGVFWLYPDGARREVQLFGLLEEPPNPDDLHSLRQTRRTREQVELELLERQREYHATRLARLTQEFKNKKEQMLGGIYMDSELADLNKLAKTVHVCRHELDGIEEEIRQVSPRHKAAERNAAYNHERQQRIEAVRSINI